MLHDADLVLRIEMIAWLVEQAHVGLLREQGCDGEPASPPDSVAMACPPSLRGRRRERRAAISRSTALCCQSEMRMPMISTASAR
jgi:hypothetical protein